MYIAQDVVDLIVDQLSACNRSREHHLRAASLVSTVWVNRSQHHLFSILKLRSSKTIHKWCSRIKPDPYGVSRHVRVLLLGHDKKYFRQPLVLSDTKAALPHLTSFKNLQELIIYYIDLENAPLGVLVPIFSSFTGTLKRLRWTQEAAVHETWKIFSTLADLFPNIAYVSLGYRVRGGEDIIQIRLSATEGRSFAIKNIKFHELRIFGCLPCSPLFFKSCGPHLQVLDLNEFDMWLSDETDFQNFQALLEACHTLQVLSFSLFPCTARFLGSISSDSVSLIHINNPIRWGNAPTTYNDSWPWKSFEEFERRLSQLHENELAEFTHLGVSIRKIARRYSQNHPGSKTRVRATTDLKESETHAVENGELPFFKTSLEEELGNYVNLELILEPYSEFEYNSDT